MAPEAEELALVQRDVDALVMMIARQRDVMEQCNNRGQVREEGLLLRHMVQLLTLLENRRDHFARELSRLRRRPKAQPVG